MSATTLYNPRWSGSAPPDGVTVCFVCGDPHPSGVLCGPCAALWAPCSEDVDSRLVALVARLLGAEEDVARAELGE